MIDGIQILNIESADLSVIDWQCRVSRKTGEIEEKATAKYKGLFLVNYPNGRVTLNGSLTTFFKGNNIQNLNFEEICMAVDELCKELNLDANNTLLNGIEIGLNVPLEYNPKFFLNSLITWGKNEPVRWVKNNENYVQFSNSQLTFKLYSKSEQFNLSTNLLRCELRINVMRYANKKGVFTLSDLTKSDKLEELLGCLFKAFNNLIYYDDTIVTGTLKKADKRLLEKGNNPRYWSNKDLHRNTLLKNKIRFKKLVEKHGKRRHHIIINSLIAISKELLQKGVQNQHLLNQVSIDGNVQNHTLNSKLNCTCLVTNLEKVVSQQVGRFLTAKDVEYYYYNNYSIYRKLVDNFLSNSYKDIDYSSVSIKKRFIEIAHRIRAVDYNSRNNSRNNTKRAIKRILSEPTKSLFDNWMLICDKKKRIAGMI